VPATNPEPERISLSVPLIPRRRSVLAARGDPLAHIESRRITPCKKAWNKLHKSKINNCNKKKKKTKCTVYVDVLKDACPAKLLTDTKLAACATNP